MAMNHHDREAQSPLSGRSHGPLHHHHAHAATRSRDAESIVHTAASGFSQALAAVCIFRQL